MENYVLLKWGSIKGWSFDDDFVKNNEKVVTDLNNIWDVIYEKSSCAIIGSEKVHKDENIKLKLIEILEKLYNLGVVFQNNFTDEYYNNFDEIKDYILNYGE